MPERKQRNSALIAALNMKWNSHFGKVNDYHLKTQNQKWNMSLAPACLSQKI